jgi:hypothetical protein
MGISVAVKYNWRKQQNNSDCYQIDIRVTIDREPQYYPVNVPQKVPIGDWSGEAPTWVKNSNPFAFTINKEILRVLGVINDLQNRLFLQKRKLNFHLLDRELGFIGNRQSFNDYFRHYIKNPPELVKDIKDGTWEKYTSFLGHLDKFNPRLRFDQIDVEMVARIRNYISPY